jgi:hypothetical protein
MTGSTVPRRLTTPRTNAGACGIAVVGVHARISRIAMMSTPSSFSSMPKVMS